MTDRGIEVLAITLVLGSSSDYSNNVSARGNIFTVYYYYMLSMHAFGFWQTLKSHKKAYRIKPTLTAADSCKVAFRESWFGSFTVSTNGEVQFNGTVLPP